MVPRSLVYNLLPIPFACFYVVLAEMNVLVALKAPVTGGPFEIF